MQGTEVQAKKQNHPVQTPSTTTIQSTSIGSRAKRQARRLGKENRGISRKHQQADKVAHDTPDVNEVISSGGSSFSQSSPSDSGRSSLGNNPRAASPKREEFKDCDTTLVNTKSSSVQKFKQTSFNKTVVNCIDSKKENKITNSKRYPDNCADDENEEFQISHSTSQPEESNSIEESMNDTKQETMKLTKTPPLIDDGSIQEIANDTNELMISLDKNKTDSNPERKVSSEKLSVEEKEQYDQHQRLGDSKHQPDTTSLEFRKNNGDYYSHKNPSSLLKPSSQNKMNKNSPNFAFDFLSNPQMMYFYNQVTGQIIMLPIANTNGLDARSIEEQSAQSQQAPIQNPQFIYPSISTMPNQFMNMSTPQIDMANRGNNSQGVTDDYSFINGQSNPSSLDTQNFHNLLPLIFQNSSQGNFNVEQYLAWQQSQQQSLSQNPSQQQSSQTSQNNPLLLCPNGPNGNNFIWPISTSNNPAGNFVNLPSSPMFLDSNQAMNGQASMRNSFLFNSLYNNKNSMNFPSSSNGNNYPGRNLFFPQLPIQQPNISLTSSGNNSNNGNGHSKKANLRNHSGNNNGGLPVINSNGSSPNQQASNGGPNNGRYDHHSLKSDKLESKNFQKFLFNCENLPFLNPDLLKPKRHSSQTNLYLRGLPKDFTEEQLYALAPDKSLIRSVKLIVEDESECYGFIDFNSNESAKQALNHIKEENSNIYVNFAYESEKDPLNIYITNIPEIWTASNVEDLKKIFVPYGQISTAIVMTKRSNNFCTGAGFVRFCRSEDAQKAIEGIRKAHVIIEGAKRPLEVKLADRQKTPEEQALLSQLKNSSNVSIKNFYRNVDHSYTKNNIHIDQDQISSANQNGSHSFSNQLSTNQPSKNNKNHLIEGVNSGSASYRGGGKNRSNHMTPVSGLTNEHHPASNEGLPFPNQTTFPFPANGTSGYNSKMNLAVAVLRSPAVFSAALAASNVYNDHQNIPDNVYYANQQWTGDSSEPYPNLPSATPYQM